VKVLTIANHTGTVGGLERSQFEICTGLAARGHHVSLLYMKEGDLLQLWRDGGVDVHPIKGSLPRRASPLGSGVGLVAALLSGIRTRPDVIYVHRYWDVPFGAALGALSRSPLVAHLHLAPPQDFPQWLRTSIAKVDCAIAVSEHTSRLWGMEGVDEERLVVVPNGVDSIWYRPPTFDERIETRRALGVAEGAFVVGYVGRIDVSKGVNILIDAYEVLRAAGVPIALVVAGGPGVSDDRRYARSIRARAFDLDIKWLGPQKDVRNVYWGADVVAVPSVRPEAHPLVVLEALATATPIVASNVGGVPEAVPDDLRECLVEPGSAQQLAEKLQSFAAGGERLMELGLVGRRWIEQRYSWERTISSVEAAIAHTVAAGRGWR